jgi:hypothetical protein
MFAVLNLGVGEYFCLVIPIIAGWFYCLTLGIEIGQGKNRVLESAILCLVWGPVGLLCSCLLPPPRKKSQLPSPLNDQR